MLRFLILFLFSILLHVSSQANVLSTPWEQTENSSKQLYKVQMHCESPLNTGEFQQCHLIINALNASRGTQSLEHLKILIGGGMPAHSHGLPTEPIINWSHASKTYLIKGLKFSMPGKWVLHFYIDDKENNIKDVVSFNFII